ncbi:peptidoglycan recognition protein family protein [Pseudonocardia xinjiangensis]|uniref:peptidoglycan recognition protein family protein n=1 Tax=Pseudonocardia xinjiangensis TaxID=75289 RepID=UPI003D934366
MSVRWGDWRPLGPQTQSKMSRHDIICLHTMVGTLAGTDSYFRQSGYGGTESHWGVGGDGRVFQWQDTDYVAEANLNGNHHVLSVETADIGPEFPRWDTADGAEVPAWTEAQMDSLAEIIARCCVEYDIPCALIPDSLPGRRGIGYHRQGVRPYMVAGGELWSAANGKVCPGDRRIAQIPDVISKAQAIIGGNEMSAETERKIDEIHTELVKRLDSRVHHMGDPDNMYGHVVSVRNMLTDMHRQLCAVLDGMAGRPGPDRDTQWGHNMSTFARVKRMEAKLAEIKTILAGLLPEEGRQK